MSTHATLGVKLPNGEISGCYVHYDGATMTPRIADFLEKNTTTGLVVLISQAQTKGGIRSFHCKPLTSVGALGPEPVTDFLLDDEPYVIDEKNFYDDHGCTYAWYLVDYETGTITMETGKR